MKKIAASLTIVCAMVCSISFAQSTTSATGTSSTTGTDSSTMGSGTADSTTVNFVTNAAMSDMKEITAAKLALTKGKSAAVKAYASKMIMHHTMTSKKMMALVKSKGYQIPPPPAPTPDPTLTSATGANFDRAYITLMVSDHQKAVQLYQKASTNVADPDFKNLAVKTLPMIKEHLTSAESIASKMKTSTTASSK